MKNLKNFATAALILLTGSVGFAGNGQIGSATNKVSSVAKDLTLSLSGGHDRFMYQNGTVFSAKAGSRAGTTPTIYTRLFTSFDASKPYCDMWSVSAETKAGEPVEGTVIIPQGTAWQSTYLEGISSSGEPVRVHVYLSCFKGVIDGQRIDIDATNRDEVIAVTKGLVEYNF
ncbi:hypothetical protein QJS83_08355 [Bdellovibrio sp. 22V]|uniref:hypothetical protein n=1 Tax=Bdellovibrio TaxID=958 RepID=UPI0025429346|nr:hypothetical protein [Bdellovibrio sp. 22V]WII73888.1 hypothetical protein QJS83_08355 [Bdellovibrio sp. 22V]